MGNKARWILDKIKDLVKDKIKDLAEFDDFIEKLKEDKEFNLQIENHLCQNQSQSIVNNSGTDSDKYIRLLEENISLRDEVSHLKNNKLKIKITKAEHELYLLLLKTDSPFTINNSKLAGKDNEFAQLRSKEIIKPCLKDLFLFEIVIFEKDFEVEE